MFLKMLEGKGLEFSIDSRLGCLELCDFGTPYLSILKVAAMLSGFGQEFADREGGGFMINFGAPSEHDSCFFGRRER